MSHFSFSKISIQDINMNAFNFPQRAYELSSDITTSEWLSRCYYTTFKDYKHFGISVCDKNFKVSLLSYFNCVQFIKLNKCITSNTVCYCNGLQTFAIMLYLIFITDKMSIMSCDLVATHLVLLVM